MLKKGIDVSYFNPEIQEFQDEPSFHCTVEDLEVAEELMELKRAYRGGELQLITIPNYELEYGTDEEE